MCTPVAQRLRCRPSNCNSLLHVSLSLYIILVHLYNSQIKLARQRDFIALKETVLKIIVFLKNENKLQYNISHHDRHTFCLPHAARKSIMLCTSGSPIFQENECDASLQWVWFQALNRYFAIGIDNSINKMSVHLADTLYTILYLESGALENVWLLLMVTMGSLQSPFCCVSAQTR